MNFTIQHHNLEHHRIERVVIVYGFFSDSPHYDMVMTIVVKRGYGFVYGFVSKKPLDINNFRSLWAYLKDNLKIRFLVFEALLEHSVFYKEHLPVVKIEKVKTFNGHDCEKLTVDLRGDLR